MYKQLIEELRHDKLIAEERERRMYKEIDQLKDKIDTLTLALSYTPQNIQPDSKADSQDEHIRTNTNLQENVQPEQSESIENPRIPLPEHTEPEPEKRGFWSRFFKPYG